MQWQMEIVFHLRWQLLTNGISITTRTKKAGGAGRERLSVGAMLLTKVVV
jgi:hypothetical protein